VIPQLVLHGAKNPHSIKVCTRAGVLSKLFCFTDNDPYLNSFMGFDVFQPEKFVVLFPEQTFEFCNLVTGSAVSRFIVYRQLKQLGVSFTSLIDPSVDLDYVQFGESSYIQEGVSLQAKVILDHNVSIHVGTVVGHETTIGHSSFIAHGCSISGEVKIEDQVFIGAGASVLPRKTIGRGAVIGAGAVVTKDVPEYEVWAGNPARRINVKY
jgi:sugar O-acyltransferase (sialic acid O-acetyltransferase NeuD family)